MPQNKKDDLSGLIFTRSSATKVFGLEDLSSPTIPSLVLSTFTLFSRLPVELGLIIWNLAVSESRLIVVSYTTNTGELDIEVFVDTPPPPPCLSVCHESRAVALKKYQKCFITDKCSSPTSLNFENDRFLIGGPDANIDMDYLMSILLPGENSHKVRFLHMSRGCWKQFAYWKYLRSRFSGLEELTISFPSGASLLPYTHDCWYGALSRENKEIVVKIELHEHQEDHHADEPRWKPGFELRIIHYDSPPSKGNY
jgi:hypothetical protein